MTKHKFRLPPFRARHIVSTLSQAMGWGLTQLHVPETWTITQGEDINILIIDTGYSNHNDLVGAMIKEKCKSFVLTESIIDDFNGHSSHVSGIIGARNNDFGMVGIAPKCNIITYKVLDQSGVGEYQAIYNALKGAINLKPDIISMSLGGPDDDASIHRLIEDLYDMDIPIIAAAGNEGENGVMYPGNYEEVITVGAFDKDGKIANFSSVGDGVDFAAPGVQIYSTYLNNKFCIMNGTSQATPFFAGLVALLLSKHRKQEKETGQNDCKTITQIREHLIKYADDKGIVGKDKYFGYGVIDVYKLIYEGESVAEPPPIQQPPQKKTVWQRLAAWWRNIVG